MTGEKKKHPPIHEGLIQCLESPFASSTEIALIAHLYGKLDSKCPAAAIPAVITAFESRLKSTPGLEDAINLAIGKLREQLEEQKAEKKNAEIPDCTNCHGKLEKIEKPDGLSEEEWDGEKRGDLFCPGCHRFFLFTDGKLKPGYDD